MWSSKKFRMLIDKLVRKFSVLVNHSSLGIHGFAPLAIMLVIGSIGSILHSSGFTKFSGQLGYYKLCK